MNGTVPFVLEPLVAVDGVTELMTGAPQQEPPDPTPLGAGMAVLDEDADLDVVLLVGPAAVELLPALAEGVGMLTGSPTLSQVDWTVLATAGQKTSQLRILLLAPCWHGTHPTDPTASSPSQHKMLCRL